MPSYGRNIDFCYSINLVERNVGVQCKISGICFEKNLWFFGGWIISSSQWQMERFYSTRGRMHSNGL